MFTRTISTDECANIAIILSNSWSHCRKIFIFQNIGVEPEMDRVCTFDLFYLQKPINVIKTQQFSLVYFSSMSSNNSTYTS